jgi:hypothetical protein
MKILSYRTWLLLSLFVSLFLGFGLSAARAEVKDLGDICFTLSDGTFRPPQPAQVERIGVLQYGAGHIALHGKVGSDPVHGTAIINGNDFIVTLNTSFVSTNLAISSFSVIHLVVNSVTLQGTYRRMTTQTSPPPPISYSSVILGTVSFVPCN